MSVCLLFVFAALLEYAIVNMVERRGELKKAVNNANTPLLKRLASASLHLSRVSLRSSTARRRQLPAAQARSKNEDATNEHTDANTPATASLIRSSYSASSNRGSNVNQQFAKSRGSFSPLTQTPPEPATQQSPRDSEAADLAQLIDLLSSFLFPTSFLFFNVLYWYVYLKLNVLSFDLV